MEITEEDNYSSIEVPGKRVYNLCTVSIELPPGAMRRAVTSVTVKVFNIL